MNWFINFFNSLGIPKSLSVGSRIKTKHGWVTVTGGSINVILDEVPTDWPDRKTNKAWSYNLKDINNA